MSARQTNDGGEVHPFVRADVHKALEDYRDRLTRSDDKRISKTDVAAWVLSEWAKANPPERPSEKAMRLAYKSRKVRERRDREQAARDAAAMVRGIAKGG